MGSHSSSSATLLSLHGLIQDPAMKNVKKILIFSRFWSRSIKIYESRITKDVLFKPFITRKLISCLFLFCLKAPVEVTMNSSR